MINCKITSADIVNSLGAGISILDRKLRIVWLNKYQSDWFGEPHNVCGKHCYEVYKHTHHVCWHCPSARVFKSGKIEEGLSIATAMDGQKHHYYLTVSPIKDRDGKVLYAVELVQDVTEQVIRQREKARIMGRLKRMLFQLSSMNRRLRHNARTLKKLTQQMGRMRSFLQKKYRRTVDELTIMKKEFEDIFKVNRIIISSANSKKIFGLITKFTCELMHTDACILRLFDTENKLLTIHASYGLSAPCVKKIESVKFGESLCGKVAQTKKPLSVFDIDKDPLLKNPETLKQEGFKSLFCVPVIFRSKADGVITLFSRKQRLFSHDETEVLNIFSSQVGVVVHESKYYEDTYKNYFSTVHALVLAMETKDFYTRGHTERVTMFALQIARAIGVPTSDIELLRYASEVHDLGKIGIPDFILNKPGKLNPAERAVIEMHPIKGAEMLEPLEFMRPAIPIVRHHHERYDGRGYPDGLEREKIPLLSRILACADSFDAMTSERPYRKRKLTIEEALSEIKSNSGSQFDPRIANLFIRTIRNEHPFKALAS